MNPMITIDMDKHCAECGQAGTVPSGICMACTAKAISRTRMKSPEGRVVQIRHKHSLEEHMMENDDG